MRCAEPAAARAGFADMSYSFEPGETPEEGLRRIAASQCDKALEELARGGPHGTLAHELRKRCKKLRGLVRLVRPVFPDYAEENRALRDAARRLEPLRDRAALDEAVDALEVAFDRQVSGGVFEALRARIGEARREGLEEAAREARLEDFREEMLAVRRRAEGWALETDGKKALTKGLRKTYARARDAMAAAEAEPDAERLHEFRKRVKYHWYHCRLMKRAAPKFIAPQRKLASKLADVLGEHNDLADLEAAIDGWGGVGSGEEEAVLRGLIVERREALAEEAFAEGALLLVEKPKPLAKRFDRYRALAAG